MRRILVTRPEPGATRTARKLRALGFDPIVMPLSRIVSLPVDASQLSDCDAVAITSENALRHIAPTLLPLAKRCFAVGPNTADAARRSGFSDVVEGPGDADRLAALIVNDLGAGARLLYSCGRVRLFAFEQALAQAGIAVTAIETYDTVELELDGASAAAIIGDVPVDAALVYSAKAAAAYARLSSLPDTIGLFSATTTFCLSPRIALRAARGASNIRVSPEPTEDALLKSLEKEW